MNALGWVGVGITVVGLAGLLASEARQDRRGKWLTKPLASIGFLVVAFSQSPAATAGQWFAAGLVLGAVGDVLLIADGRRSFLAGLVAFLLGHVAYIVAFVAWGIASDIALVSLAPLAVIAALISTRLLPYVPDPMRAPVLAYMVVITLMVAAAAGAVGSSPWAAAPLAFGALLFYLSDLAVARQRFVEAGFVNRAVGLPLYYAGQSLIAVNITATA